MTGSHCMLHVVSQPTHTSKYNNRQRAMIEKALFRPGILSTMNYNLAYSDLYNAKMSLQAWIPGSYHVKDVAFIGAIVIVCIWTAVHAFDRWNRAVKLNSPRPFTPDLEKKPSLGSRLKKSDRKPGGMLYPIRLSFGYHRTGETDCQEWPPSDFKRPTASPYQDWDVLTTKPIPYRPFRYGP